MNKTILFRVGTFPMYSETFIITQLITALHEGYQIKILVKGQVNTHSNNDDARIKDYNLLNYAIEEDYNIPSGRFLRIMKALFILMRKVKEIRKIISFYGCKRRFELASLFQFHFYSQFKEVDLIHIQYGTNSNPIDELKRIGFFEMPVITTFHGHDAFFPINGFIPNNGYYDNLFEVGNIFTANTAYLKSQLIKLGCSLEKLLIIPASVDTNYFHARLPRFIHEDSPKTLLSVGRLENIKGHHLGIKVVKELVQRGHKIQYKIIGAGRNKGKLEQMISNLSLEKTVHLLGAKSPEEIRKAYWDSYLFMMTSTVFEGQIRETQGLVALEAQSCGLPVVAFDTGGVKYTIQDGRTGILCKENDLLEFSNSVEKLLNDEILYKKFSLEGPTFVKNNFSAEVVSTKWKGLYKELMND